MTYSITEVAKKFGMTAHTLRYYDKEGLMPYVERSSSGIRKFKDRDFEWLNIINCLKASGVPVKKIKEFVDWCMEGDNTIEKRLEFLQNHKKDVENQLSELNKHMEMIDYKIGYYKAAAAAGTVAIHNKTADN